jgi:hypothetical protein
VTAPAEPDHFGMAGIALARMATAFTALPTLFWTIAAFGWNIQTRPGHSVAYAAALTAVVASLVPLWRTDAHRPTGLRLAAIAASAVMLHVGIFIGVFATMIEWDW